MTEPVIELKNISKSFSGIPANTDISITLKQGEIHALLGENGAGKSTLMNIISGMLKPDDGQILLNGSPLNFNNPGDSIRSGIGMIHQHFMIVPGFTNTENIILGNEITKGPFLDLKKAKETVKNLSESYGLAVDPDAITDTLPVGLQQRVEILKALYTESSVLILDEPTAVLTPQETGDLFAIMKRLTARGVSIFFITHKLPEVMAIADRITVIQHGRITGSTTPSGTDETSLAEMMVGKQIDLDSPWTPGRPGHPVLEIQSLSVKDTSHQSAVSDLSLTLRNGEILGIAGVQGNGQTELAEALTGLRPPSGGSIMLSGEPVPFSRWNPQYLIDSGLGHIPEDRQKHGLILSFSIEENQILPVRKQSPFARAGHKIRHNITAYASSLIKRFDIRTTGHDAPAGSLSGGNQQKVVISRELSRKLNVLIASQPTRGLDVGAISTIHKHLLALRDSGTGILLISSELDEILSLSDRIAVMYRGKIVSETPRGTLSKEETGKLMGGFFP